MGAAAWSYNFGAYWNGVETHCAAEGSRETTPATPKTHEHKNSTALSNICLEPIGPISLVLPTAPLELYGKIRKGA